MTEQVPKEQCPNLYRDGRGDWRHQFEITHLSDKTKLPLVCPHCGETCDPSQGID